MGVFDTSNVSQQGGTAVSPSAGVADKSNLVGLQAASNLLSFGLDVAGGIQKKAAQDASNEATNSFAQGQLKVANAVDRGDMSSAEGRRIMRTNAQRALANGLSFKSVKEVQSGLVGTAGLGKVAAEGTDQEQRLIKLETEAFQSGFIPTNATDVQREEGMELFQLRQRSLADINFQASKLSLTGQKIDVNDKVRTNDAQKAVGDLGFSEMGRLSTRAEDIMAQFNSGVPVEELLQVVRDEWAEARNAVTAAGPEAGNMLQVVTQPILDQEARLTDFLTGKISVEVMKREVDKNISTQNLIITSDPEVARAISVSQYFRGVVGISPVLETSAAKAITMNGKEGGNTGVYDPVPETPEGKETAKQYFNNLKLNMSLAGESLDPTGFTEAMRTQVDSVLQGVSDQAGNIQNTTDLNQVADFIASSDFGTFTQETGGIPADRAAAAKAVMDSQYEDVVLPLLRQEVENTTFRSTLLGAGGTPALELIEPTYSAGGVVFRPRQGVTMNARSLVELRSLNRKVSPTLNRLVRMGAHLEGNRNYEKVFNENYAGIFGEEQTTNEAE